MQTLSTHPTPIQNVIPPTDWVMLSVIVDLPERGSHWFLRDGRRRRHNAHGHALLTYRVRPTEATQFRVRGEYCVARLLLEHHRGPFPPRTRHTSICGLSQCLNPFHWTVDSPPYPWRIEVNEHGYWQAVSTSTGFDARERIVARAAGLDRKVHVIAFDTWAKRAPGTPPIAVCGYVFDPRRLHLTDVPVTCTGGC